MDHADEVEQDSRAASQFRELAAEQYGHEGEIEIDDGALVSYSGAVGAYVAAWVWVYGKICRKCREVFQGSDAVECDRCAKQSGVDDTSLT